MSEYKKEIKVRGTGFLGMLTILFIGLKLGEIGKVAEWSWFWVLSPIWLPFALIGALFAIVVMFIFISSLLSKVGI